MEKKRDVIITEVALRDGSHALGHQFTIDQVTKIVSALDGANVPYVEVAHGDGLSGSSLQYGFSKVNEMELIEAAVGCCKQAKVAVLLIPGIGTIGDLRDAAKLGVKMARIATHVTEANISAQQIAASKTMGLETVGFLMMAHMAPVKTLVAQAKLMESYGADVVCVVDSAGSLLPHEVKERIRALTNELSIEVGFHAHNNLSLAVANSIVAIEEGATRIDGSVRCLGAGAGNTQTEVLVAVLEKLGIWTGVDLYKMMDLSEDTIVPILPQPQEISRDHLLLGYAGVYSSFLLHVKNAAKQFNINSGDILRELGKLKVVGGQEDKILDVAARIAKENECLY